ncbi:hypothetical protein MBLNU459_g5730t1 [Dothideomycetes sp. NU459]
MRIPIREQLAGLILIASAIGLGVISIATWYTNHNFVLEIRSSRLSLTASLKAAQLASSLSLMESSAQFIASRVLIQQALTRYNTFGNNSAANWAAAQADMAAAIAGGNTGGIGQSLLLQSKILPKTDTGPAGFRSVLNTTGAAIPTILLPYRAPDGSPVYLSDTEYGYPPALYPNLTYAETPLNSTFDEAEAIYNGEVLTAPNSTLLLGPYHINETFSLLSLTLPIVNNTSDVDVLGWLCLVLDARLIGAVLTSTEGLGETGECLLIGPTNTTNHFPNGVLYDSVDGSTVDPSDVQVQFMWPLPNVNKPRHPGAAGLLNSKPFSAERYPAVATALTKNQGSANNAGSEILTVNEANNQVSVGFAMPNTPLADWVIIVEQSRNEIWQPIVHLRKVLLACVFGTLGAMMLLAWPLAHFASTPIRRLREATRKTVLPSGYSDSNYSRFSQDGGANGDGTEDDHDAVLARKEGFFGVVSSWNRRRRHANAERREEYRRRKFRIPGKVKDRNHCIQDELTDLTRTFNEMSDELMMQYERLEERVQKRTAELEVSKKAAEAANESKTLFIANISHELKTPLNGILGMCAVCMQEEDQVKLKRSLGIIYKSGDLLLNLLTDLLTFSKNQVGQQLSLDEKEFRLRDISSQVLAIFDKQAKDGEISLRVDFQGPEPSNGIVPSGEEDRKTFGPLGTGRVKDMVVWGDQHRILQVVINLVSNSLKFTPPGGVVVLTIRCLGDAPETASRKPSIQSRTSRQVSSRHKSSLTSLASPPSQRVDTANQINIYGEKNAAFAHIMAAERSASPPPGRNLVFEFEVTDSGPGIADDQQERIFEPFVQGDLGLSKKYGGTGLGLSICSQLAGLMRGTMGLQSEVGLGSTFTMKIPLRHLMTRTDSTASSIVGPELPDGARTPNRQSRVLDDNESRRSVHSVQSGQAASPSLPSAAAPSQAFKPDSQPRLVGLSHPFFTSNQPMESPGSQPAAIDKITADAQNTGKIRVLVAEDNKVNQEVVLRMLKLEDIYDVTVAKDGQEALDLVKESMEAGRPAYNLIFMDVQMPNLDGLQSTRLIRQMGYEAPIVALTAFAEESNVKDCLDSGMNYFLSKPIRRPALKQVLKEYCAPIPELDEDVSPMLEKPKPVPSNTVDTPGSQVSISSNNKNTVLVLQKPRSNSLDGGRPKLSRDK